MTDPTPYEKPSVEDITNGDSPIGTLAGISNPPE
jgi:hypothetical protein